MAFVLRQSRCDRPGLPLPGWQRVLGILLGSGASFLVRIGFALFITGIFSVLIRVWNLGRATAA
ncbi:MAG: hypothetical protein FWD08_04865 [Alphaproteobacteria bacterium]|nr:hypothetical protein [Alphaproteobacteria bacterium]